MSRCFRKPHTPRLLLVEVLPLPCLVCCHVPSPAHLKSNQLQGSTTEVVPSFRFPSICQRLPPFSAEEAWSRQGHRLFEYHPAQVCFSLSRHVVRASVQVGVTAIDTQFNVLFSTLAILIVFSRCPSSASCVVTATVFSDGLVFPPRSFLEHVVQWRSSAHH